MAYQNPFIFYRDVGIRRIGDFENPKKLETLKLKLPKNSILHYFTFEENFVGPNGNIGIMEANKGGAGIFIKHLTSLSSTLSNPLRLEKEVRASIVRYKKINPEVHRLKKHIRDFNDPITLAVVNYGILGLCYRYRGSNKMLDMHKWKNLLYTLIDNCNRLAKDTPRHNYVIVDAPSKSISKEEYKSLSKKSDKVLASSIKDPYQYMMFSLMAWLNGKPSEFDMLDDKGISNTTFLLRANGKVAVLSLRYLQLLKGNVDYDRDRDARSGLSASNTIADSTLLGVLPDLIDSLNFRSVVVSDPVTKQSIKAEDNLAVIQEEDVIESTPDEKALDVAIELEQEPVQKDPPKNKETPDVKMETHLQMMLDNDLVTGSSFKKIQKEVDQASTLVSPLVPGVALKDIKITPEDVAVEEVDLIDPVNLIDKSMSKSTLKGLDKHYVEKVMPKHISMMVGSMKNSGIIVKDYKVKTVSNIVGSFEIHDVKVRPAGKQISTLRFRIPTVDDEGVIRTNNSSYRLKKQEADLPIRKISSSRVALSSYFGKMFISRSELVVDNRVRKIQVLIQKASLDLDSGVKITPISVFDPEMVLPRIYTGLGEAFKDIRTPNVYLYFKYVDREEVLFKDSSLDIKSVEKSGKYTVIGKNKDNEFLVIDNDNLIYRFRANKHDLVGDITYVLGLDSSKVPSDIAVMKIMGKEIPVALYLAYSYGLKNLLKKTSKNTKVHRVNKRVVSDNIVLTFKDAKLEITPKDAASSLILEGLSKYSKALADFNFKSFDDKDVYLAISSHPKITSNKRLTVNHYKEMGLITDMFVDPITEDVLLMMKEPTEIRSLVVRAVELLTTDWYPRATDANYTRTRGYERIPGAIYKELVKTLRSHNFAPNNKAKKLTMGHFEVWQAINSDPSLERVRDINPIQNLKEQEVVTLQGVGGRSKDTLMEIHREVHKSSLGKTSEATVDNAQVGSTSYLSANPQFKNIYGMSDSIDDIEDNPAAALSTSSLLASSSDKDDPKRRNFINIQNSHIIQIAGAEQLHVRTGYESVISHRVGKKYAVMADQDGKVISIDKEGILVEYADGETLGVTLGDTFGESEGITYKHTIVTALREKQKFKKGQHIAYHSGFFEIDELDPTGLVMKNATTAKVALYESSQTFEDGSTITKAFSEKMTTETVKVSKYTIGFNQAIHELVKIGQEVKYDQSLFIVEDEITASSQSFSNDSIKTLQSLSGFAPKAKVNGIIKGIEVLYHGDKSDMSDSVLKVVAQSNKRLRDKSKAVGKEPVTGEVDTEYMTKGKPLPVGSIEIKIYIVSKGSAGTGDKGIFAHQMKSTFSEVISHRFETDTGLPLDGAFGDRSISARIVHSPKLIGTATTLLSTVLPQKLWETYKK